METLHIYHTNDLHSHFEHWPRIKELIRERKEWHKLQGDDVLVFDIGDHMDRWHPLSDATQGKGNVDLLNQAGYDAVTIGNNEGITLSHEGLDKLYENRNFKVLLANLYTGGGSRPSWAEPYATYTTEGGVRIGVVGVTAKYPLLYSLLGWEITDPFEELGKMLKELKKQTDMIVLLSHLGINDDEEMARVYPEIDIILGGHTHHILHKGKVEGNTLLAAAGKYGQYAGHIVVDIDPSTKKIVSKNAQLYEIQGWKAAPNEEAETDELYRKGKKMLSGTTVVLPERIEAASFAESRLSSLLCDALKEWCEADCAFLNAGLLLDGLEMGLVTDFDLLSICPHPINPCTVKLKGAQLKEVLLQTKDEKWPHLQIMGLGFRGKIMGTFVYAGIEFPEKVGKPYLINGQPLEHEREYTLAIPDMFTFGKFFPAVYRAEQKKYFLPEFLRDVLKWKLQMIYNE